MNLILIFQLRNTENHVNKFLWHFVCNGEIILFIFKNLLIRNSQNFEVQISYSILRCKKNRDWLISTSQDCPRFIFVPLSSFFLDFEIKLINFHSFVFIPNFGYLSAWKKGKWGILGDRKWGFLVFLKKRNFLVSGKLLVTEIDRSQKS